MITANAGLNVILQLIECDVDAGLVSFAYSLVFTDQSSERNGLWRAERRIPSRPMLHRSDVLVVLVGVFARRLVPDQLSASDRVLAFAQPLELFFGYLAVKAPLLGKFAVPLAANFTSLRVIRLLGVRELLGVIRLSLTGTERLGNRKHGNSLLHHSKISSSR